MGEQHGEVGIHLLKCGQQAFAPLAVEAGDSIAQFTDRPFEIGLFGNQRVVLFLYLTGVFLGAQVDRAKRIALPFQAVHVGLDRL